MRVVSWNLAYWKPGRYKTVENRRRQWSYLLGLEPDVALLQECRPTDLQKFASESAQAEYSVIGTIPHKWTACSAILVRRELRAEPDTRPDPWLDALSGYVARARIAHSAIGEVCVASVHAIAKEANYPSLSDADHLRIKRSGCKRAWNNDVAASALRGWAEGSEFVIGGDWNTARAFDEMYGEQWPEAGREFFEVTARWGWCESLRKFHPDEVRTYLDSKSAPYELDHLFTSQRLEHQLEKCDVVTDSAITELSDHAPIVAEFNIEKIVARSNRFSDWSPETVTITLPAIPPAAGDQKA